MKNMLHARRCRAAIDAGAKWDERSEALSPLNMVCSLQSVENGVGICDPKNIYQALDFIVDTGLIRHADLKAWRDSHMAGKSELWITEVAEAKDATLRWVQEELQRSLREGLELTEKMLDGLVDISKPEVKSCDRVFQGNYLKTRQPVKVENYVSSMNHKKSLLSGPVIASIRLTWEFQSFTGSLFNPKGTQTFCRMSKQGDDNDYCDPARKNAWDKE